MFTTSRYASEETRLLARKMAGEKGEMFFARGKKTIAQLVAMARRLGEKEITIVEDSKPPSLAVIAVSETGAWAWKAT